MARAVPRNPRHRPQTRFGGSIIGLAGIPKYGLALFVSLGAYTAGMTYTRLLPRLAGQHAQYTEKQLTAFNKRDRTNDNAVMHGIASKLNELELKSVAAYISGLE